jgi:hypothetical protein
MPPPRSGRHGDRRPYQPDTGAAQAEEAAARKALGEGRLALAPRAAGWVQVWSDDAGALTEAPLLDDAGQPVAPWDTEGLARWMGNAGGAQRKPSVLARLRALAGG